MRCCYVPESGTPKGTTPVNKRRGKKYLCKNVLEVKKTSQEQIKGQSQVPEGRVKQFNENVIA